jgi:hypothetical protein
MGGVRLIVSALVLALLGLGSFWLWHEATAPSSEPLAGVVRSAPGTTAGPGETAALSEATPRSATGAVPEALTVDTAPRGAIPAVARAAAQVWQEIAVDAGAGSTPSTSDGDRAGGGAAADEPRGDASGPGSSSAGRGSSGPATGEPEAVHRAPVDPDEDDDDDDDDDEEDDDEDDDAP